MAVTNTMAGPDEPVRRGDGQATHAQRRAVYAVGAGSSAEALAAVGAIALSILGLAGLLNYVFASISAICIGAAFMLQGLAISSAYAEEVRHSLVDQDAPTDKPIEGGLSVEVLGGAAGVTLGILALVGVSTWPLLGVAAIVFGGTMLVGGGLQPELMREEVLTAGQSSSAQRRTGQAVRASGGVLALAGIADIALGILALIGIATHSLVLIATLVAGGAILFGGSALLSRMASVMR